MVPLKYSTHCTVTLFFHFKFKIRITTAYTGSIEERETAREQERARESKRERLRDYLDGDNVWTVHGVETER